METLFPLQPALPPGFSYVPDFLDSAEEKELLTEIAKIELHTFHFRGYEAKRRVASFGYDYSFDERALTTGKDIPAEFRKLIEKVSIETGIEKESFAELLITEYPAGSVINWHRDAFPFDVIAGISLSADCTFRLRPQEKKRQTRSAIIALTVRARSLYIMRGESRMQWQHSTAPVKSTRYSITLRTLKPRTG